MSIKISELPSASALGENDYVPIVQSGTTKKATAGMFITELPTIETEITSSSTNDDVAGALAVWNVVQNQIASNGAGIKTISESEIRIWNMSDGIYKLNAGTKIKYIGTTDDTYYEITDDNTYLIIRRKFIGGMTLYRAFSFMTDYANLKYGYSTSSSGELFHFVYVNGTPEIRANMTQTINESSTSDEYPSAEAVFSTLQGYVTQDEYNQLLDQIPTATATGETINVNDSSNLPLANFEMIGNATQDDTPTPTTPQAIHVVTGDNTITLVGKNLFDGLWGTNTSTNFIPVIAGVNYIYSEQNIGEAMNYRFYESTTGSYEQVYKSAGSAFTPAKNGYVKLYKTNSSKTQCQLEVGTTITAYVPYQGEQTVTLPLGDIELAGIGTYKDRIYKDNGKWYLYKTIGKKTLTGNETWYTESNNFYTIISTAYGKNTPTITNYFHSVSTTTNVYGDVKFAGANTNLIFYKTKEIHSSVENWQAWLETHNVEVLFILATPTTTEITDTALITALEQVLAMTTYKNVTNFSITPSGTNATGDLTLTYRQDLSTLISNLNNAILSLGNNV